MQSVVMEDKIPHCDCTKRVWFMATCLWLHQSILICSPGYLQTKHRFLWWRSATEVLQSSTKGFPSMWPASNYGNVVRGEKQETHSNLDYSHTGSSYSSMLIYMTSFNKIRHWIIDFVFYYFDNAANQTGIWHPFISWLINWFCICVICRL